MEYDILKELNYITGTTNQDSVFVFDLQLIMNHLNDLPIMTGKEIKAGATAREQVK